MARRIILKDGGLNNTSTVDGYKSIGLVGENLSIQSGLTNSIIKPYKVYSALLTQSGTASPNAIVLENTLGVGVTFSYETVGQYHLILSDDLLTDTNHAVIASTGNQNCLAILWSYKVANNMIRIEAYDYGNLSIITSNYTDNVQTGDGLLTNHMIELRIF